MSQIQETFLFTPTSVSGCALWLDAADRSTLTLSGANVTQWNDKSGNGNNPTFGTNKPTYTNGYVLTANQNQSFTVPAATVSTASGGSGSLFFVFGDTQTQAGGTYAAIFGTAQPSSNFYQSLIRADSFNYAPYQGTASFVSAMNTTNTLLYNNNYTFGSTVGSVGVNGTIYVSLNVSPQPSGAVTISGTGWGDTGNVRFYEIVFFRVSLIVAERQQIEGYLAWKWGLQGNLPANHPFKTYRPLAQTPFPTSIPPMPTIGQGTPGFSPTSITGCQLWLDAADSSTLSLSGNTVTQWRDKSGNGGNTTTIGGSPTYSANSILLNGSSTYLVGPYINTTTTLTAFVIATVNFSAGNYAQFYRLLSVGSTAANDYNNPAYAAVILHQPNTTNIGGYRNSQTNYVGVVSNVTFLLAQQYNGTTAQLYLNGNTNTSTASSGSFNTTSYSIGRDVGNTDGSPPNYSYTYWPGSISETLLYNSSLTTTERQQIEGYLAWKWGLQANLPRDHPYRNQPVQPFTITTPVRGSLNQWQPNQIPGLRLWLDAADTSTLVLSGNNVTQWNDKSGNGNNAISPAGSILVNQGQINGLGTVQFNTNSGFSRTITYTSTRRAIFVVSKLGAQGGSSFNYIFFEGSTTGISLQLYSYNGDLEFNRNGATILGTAAPSPFFNTTSIASATNSSQPGALGIFINGTAQTLSVNNGNIFSVGAGNALIGGRAAFATISYLMGEMIVIDADITRFQRQQIEGYLAWKWGLVGNLPAGHPYKLFPPPP